MDTGCSVTCKPEEARMLLAWVYTFLLSNMLLAKAYGSGGEITFFFSFLQQLNEAERVKPPDFPNVARLTGKEGFGCFSCYPTKAFFFPLSPPCHRLAAPSLPLRTKTSSHFLFPFPFTRVDGAWEFISSNPQSPTLLKSICLVWQAHKPPLSSLLCSLLRGVGAEEIRQSPSARVSIESFASLNQRLLWNSLGSWWCL